jgi:hypothetical protein
VNSDRITLVAQLAITLIVVVGFFVMLGIVTMGRASIPTDQMRLADTLFGALCAVLVQIASYWFARQRNAVADAQNS